MVDVVFFDFGCYLKGVVYSLGYILEESAHLLGAFKPFLFRIEHSAFVV